MEDEQDVEQNRKLPVIPAKVILHQPITSQTPDICMNKTSQDQQNHVAIPELAARVSAAKMSQV